MENTKNKITIAIDGHSSTGKSTLAKALAKHLNYIYVDTGAMYRAVTWYAINNDLINSSGINEIALINSLDKISIGFTNISGKNHTNVNGLDVEGYIRGLEVANWVSKIASIPQVRKKLVAEQQYLGREKGVVMDGRDIGTVVFPDAELKFFMTADAKVRAQRRYDELTEKGESVNFEEVLSNVKERDFMDENREDSPLRKAKDAVLVDNSEMSREEQLEKILSLVKKLDI